MKISKDKYNKVIIALDSIRCDNREGKTTQNLRQMDDDVMQHIERKGYCNYILGEGNIFVRTLTIKGYEVLACGTYERYLRKQKKEEFRLWTPIWVSIIMVGLTALNYYFTTNQSNKTSQLERRINSLDSSIVLLNQRLVTFDSVYQIINSKIAITDSVLKSNRQFNKKSNQ